MYEEEECNCPECGLEVNTNNLPHVKCDNCGLEDEYQFCENGHNELTTLNGGPCSVCWEEGMNEL
ncbi:hypothetical protein CN490_24885 [Bacillus cereus]|nr:hypothetical protein CN490_24885 [Bacillus cereus]